jgi:hypothetical protein
MKPWLVRLTWLGLLVAAAVWAGSVLFPSPDRVIRGELVQLAKAASIGPNEAPLARLSRAQKLSTFFTPDVQITVDIPTRSTQTFNGREEVQEAALAARSMLSELTVKFVDVVVTVDPDKQSARADLTATASLPGEKLPEVQELEVRFKKTDRDWLISRVRTVKTLR